MPLQRNAFYEAMAVIDVEHQHSLTAPFQIVTNTGGRYI